MLGNFSYYNPTKLYFGDESLNFLMDELKGYGPVVLLNYGSGSVKRNGIYDQVIAILKERPRWRQRVRLLEGSGSIDVLRRRLLGPFLAEAAKSR